MENDIFWEVFRDTGDPLCWLLTREKSGTSPEAPPPGPTEDRPSVPA